MAQRLIEKMELHDNLNPKLWENNQLRPEVEEKLDDIIDQFILELQNNDIPIKVLDARLVGSNASFNYTDSSDLDVHIVANFADTSCDVPVLNLLYNYFKKNFNDKYEISIHGVPVELYIEDINSSAVSNGIYSLYKREWIKFPEPIEIPDVDITDIFNKYKEKYQEIVKNQDAEAASDLIDELYLLRKDSISTDGEYGEGNLVFKEFRNKGHLDNLKQLLVDETSKELSLESLNEVVMLEGRDAPLYHGTQISNFIDILKTDALKPGRAYNRDIKAGREHGSISLSRNKNAATEYGDVVFTLDQSKLSDNYKITPVGDFENKYDTTHARKINNGKAEEIITEPITPLHKYLKKIEILVPENQLSGYKYIIDDYVNKFNIDIEFKISESLYVMNESKEDNNIENIKRYIKNNFNISTHTIGGPFYILSNGLYLNLGKNGSHLGLDDELYQNGIIEQDPFDYSYLYPNTIMVDLFNAIRCSDGENLGDDEYGNPYIQLPKNLPTNAQIESLDGWIYSLGYNNKLFVDGVEYNLSEVSSEYIIKRIKRYYSSGQLYESSNPEIFYRITVINPDGKEAGLFRGLNKLLKRLWDNDDEIYDEINYPLSELEELTHYPENFNNKRAIFAYKEDKFNQIKDTLLDLEYALNAIHWEVKITKIRRPDKVVYEDEDQIAYDPKTTSVVEWLNESKEDNQKLIDHVGEETAQRFFKLKPRIKSPQNDLYFWLKKEPVELQDFLDELENTKSKSQQAKEDKAGANLIYDSDGWKVYKINTYDAAKHYGKGTKWCISGNYPGDEGKGEMYFDSYKEDGVKDYYFIIHGDDKWAWLDWEDINIYDIEDSLWEADDTGLNKKVGEKPDFPESVIDALPNARPFFNYHYIPADEALAKAEETGILIVDDGTEEVVGYYLRDYKIKKVITNKTVPLGWFQNNKYIEEVIIKSPSKYIGRYSFSGCPNLKSIYIASSVYLIDDYMVAGSNANLTIYCESNEPRKGYAENCFADVMDQETGEILPAKVVWGVRNFPINESMEDHMNINFMIQEAKKRRVKPEDLFEKPFKLVDAKKFFDELTKNSSQDYKDKAKERITKNDSNQIFYKTILGYLDSLGTGKDYPKLEPASYQIKNGQFIPIDGRHRAQLCIMLGINLPVREVKTSNNKDKRHTLIDAVLFHGDGNAPYFTGFDNPEGTYKLKGSKNDFIAYITREFTAGDLLKELTVSVKPIEDGQYAYFSTALRINNSVNAQALEKLVNTVWEPYVDMLMDATYDYYKDLYDIDESFKLTEEDEKGDWGYHYGDLGNKADRRSKFGIRNSGGFGTGTYFVGTPISQRKDGGSYKNRPEHKIDFSKYNLFKPRNNEQAYKLHDALLTINNMAPNFKRVPKQWGEVLNEFDKVFDEYYAPLNALDDDDHSTPVTLNKQALLKYIRKYIDYYPYKLNKDDDLMDIAREIENNLVDEAKEFYYILNSLSSALGYYNEDKLRKIVIEALQDKSDIAPATLIMKALGYDGIDVRHLDHDAQGLSGLDNFGFGSVIYDLKESVEETGRTVIKAVVFHNEDQPKKQIPNFQDFEEDGLYRLGENDYIVFEKRWEEDPRGWGMIHADVIDDFVIPVFSDYRDRYIEEAGLEIDNLQPNSDLYYDLRNLNTKTFSKYTNTTKRAIDKYFK